MNELVGHTPLFPVEFILVDLNEFIIEFDH